MRVLATGTMTGVTGQAAIGDFCSVHTESIDLSMDKVSSMVGIWASVEGDLGRTGGSVTVIWEGCYTKSGVTYACLDDTNFTTYAQDMPSYPFAVKGGTSKAGFHSNGSYRRTVEAPFPWMRLGAMASKAGVTNHGTGTTNSCIIRWAIVAG